MDQEQERTEAAKPGYWAVLPADVRYDPALPPMARLLYAEISALTDQQGYCYASNAYLQRVFELSERTLQRHLRVLEARGFLRVENGDGGRGRRKIFAGINPMNRNPDKNDGVVRNPDKNDGVTPTKMTGSNSYQDNISIQPPKAPQGAARGSKCKAVWKPERFEKFWDYYPRMSDGSKPAKARAARAWDKLKPDDATIRAMATALQRQMQSELWSRGVGIPYASSWLNARRWEDDWQPPEDPEAEDFAGEEDLPEWTI